MHRYKRGTGKSGNGFFFYDTVKRKMKDRQGLPGNACQRRHQMQLMACILSTDQHF